MSQGNHGKALVMACGHLLAGRGYSKARLLPAGHRTSNRGPLVFQQLLDLSRAPGVLCKGSASLYEIPKSLQ